MAMILGKRTTRMLLTAMVVSVVLASSAPAYAATVTYSYGYHPYWQYYYRYRPAPSPSTPAQKPPATTPAKPAPIPAVDPGSMQMSSWELEVARLVNAERAKAGLAPLNVSAELSRVARYKAADMRDNGYFGHTSPTYGSPFQMMKDFGISYRTAGENIAAGQRSPQEVVNAWMNSSGHRANILNSSFTTIGVGHVSGGSYGNYWTQMFLG